MSESNHGNSFQSFRDLANTYWQLACTLPNMEISKLKKINDAFPKSVNGALKVGFSICQCGQGGLRLPVSQLGHHHLCPPFSPFNLSLQWEGGGLRCSCIFFFFQSIDIPPCVSSCLSCLRDGQVGWVGVSAEHCDRSMDYDSIAVGVVKAMFYKIAAAFDFSGNSDWVCCVLLTLFVS